jgi:hypothetical protein
MQLYRYFVRQSSEFCRYNYLCCFSTSVIVISVYFIIDSARELLDTPSYNLSSSWWSSSSSSLCFIKERKFKLYLIESVPEGCYHSCREIQKKASLVFAASHATYVGRTSESCSLDKHAYPTRKKQVFIAYFRKDYPIRLSIRRMSE